jgi:hypothetical protein
MLICTSEEAIETSVARCDVAAGDLLLPYGDVVMALSIVLRIKRTLDGTEIDDLRPNIGAAPTGVSESYRPTALRQNVITTMTPSLPHLAPDRCSNQRH